MTGIAGGRAHVRAVRRTARMRQWLDVVDALGGREVGGRPGERTFALGAGFLVLRPAPPDAAPASENPVTAIELGVPDDAATGTIDGPDGMSIARVRVVAAGDIGRDAPATEPSGTVSVCPLWMTPDVPGVTDVLVAAGLTVRLSAEAGQWVDLAAPGGGLVAVHADSPPDPSDPPHAVLAFEGPDVEELAERFAGRGLRADVVDEAYGRSLRIDDPDGGIELWVNETMTDLYGYRRSRGGGLGGPARPPRVR